MPHPPSDNPGARVPFWRRLLRRPPAATLQVRAQAALDRLDRAIADQLDAVLHHPALLELEGRWRGLRYFLDHAAPHPSWRACLMPCTKREVAQDLGRAVEPSRSLLFRHLHDGPFGDRENVPFGLLLFDYFWDSSERDCGALAGLSQLLEALPAVAVTGAAPALLGLDGWEELAEGTPLPEPPPRLRRLRRATAARHLVLTAPRALARHPRAGEPAVACCWMNGAWLVAARVANSVALRGWPVWIAFPESGGRISDLPWHAFPDGGRSLERVGFDEQLQPAAERAGLLLLFQHSRGHPDTSPVGPVGQAAILRAPTLSCSPIFERAEATEEAARQTRLPAMLAATRFALLLKLQARGRLAAGIPAAGLAEPLNTWLAQYCERDPGSDAPLLAGSVRVVEDGSPQPRLVCRLWPRLVRDQPELGLRLVLDLR